MKFNNQLVLKLFLICFWLSCTFESVEGVPKKGKSGSKSKISSNVKKVAGVAVGVAGTAYIGHKLRKKSKKLRKGFGDDDNLQCWICGIPGFQACPQGDGLVYRRNATDENEQENERRRLPDDDDDDDDNDENDMYDSYFGARRYCPEHADSCLTLYGDHSKEKVLMRNCFDKGFFGCYDTVQGLSGFACFCRRGLCNGSAIVAIADLCVLLLAALLHQLF